MSSIGRPSTGPIGLGLEGLVEWFGEAFGGGVTGGAVVASLVVSLAVSSTVVEAGSGGASSLREQQLPIDE